MLLPLSFNLRFHLFIRIVRYSHSISVPSIVNLNQRHRIASKISPFDYHFHKSASMNVGKRKKEKITRANHVPRMIKHARFATGARYVRDGQNDWISQSLWFVNVVVFESGEKVLYHAIRQPRRPAYARFFAIQPLLQVVRWS